MWMKRLRMLACVESRSSVPYLVTLSKEWNTMEFLHMAIATALFPYARQ